MIQHEIEENELIEAFLASASSTQDDLSSFLITNLVHPGLYSEYGQQIIKNLVGITWNYYETLDVGNKRHFIRILVKLVYLGFSMKRWAFNLSRVDAIQTYASAPLFFTFITNMIGPLETIRRELATIDSHLVMKRLLLVEGSSEINFIKTIQLSSELINLDFDVYEYGGKGQIGSLVHLIKEKTRQGVRVHLSYDTDRESLGFEDRLRKQCQVEAFFAFERDFESAFPPALLAEAINEYIRRYTKQQTRLDESSIKKLLADKMSFVAAVTRELGTTVVKSKLAIILAELTLAADYLWDEATNEKRLTTEIAKFLRFLILW